MHGRRRRAQWRPPRRHSPAHTDRPDRHTPACTRTESCSASRRRSTDPPRSSARTCGSGSRPRSSRPTSPGALHGRVLELTSLDDAYEPEAAIANTRQLIEEENVFALIGAVGTPTSRSATPIAADAGVPLHRTVHRRSVPARPGVGQHHQPARLLQPGDRGDGRPPDRRSRDRTHRHHVPGRLLRPRRLPGIAGRAGAPRAPTPWPSASTPATRRP